MRPRHKAAENAMLEERETTDAECFNEAAA